MSAPRVQPATAPCDCGSTRTVTPTLSRYAFIWRCGGCGASGVISWAHASDPPQYQPVPLVATLPLFEDA